MGHTVTDILDAKGLLCPEPVMMLHNKMRELKVGDVLQVLATDPSTLRDVPKFCTFLGHQLLEQQEQDKYYVYFIQKN